MGLSYYFHAEVRRNGRWETISPATYGNEQGWITRHNSTAYAILCDCNYYERGEFEVIQPLRGIPDNAGEGLLQAIDHSLEPFNHTWYLLSELVAFDWARKVRMCQVLAPCEYVTLKRNGSLIETDPEMEKLITDIGEEAASHLLWGALPEGCPTPKVPYYSTYREEACNLVNHDMTYLLSLGHNPEDVRVTVWCGP